MTLLLVIKNKSCKRPIGKEDMEKGLLPNYYMGQVALDYANQPLHALGDFFHIYLPCLGACLGV